MVHLPKLRNWHSIAGFESGTLFSWEMSPIFLSFPSRGSTKSLDACTVTPSVPAYAPFIPTLPPQIKPERTSRRNSYRARGSNSQAMSFRCSTPQAPLSMCPQRYPLPTINPPPANLLTNSTVNHCGHPSNVNSIIKALNQIQFSKYLLITQKQIQSSPWPWPASDMLKDIEHICLWLKHHVVVLASAAHIVKTSCGKWSSVVQWLRAWGLQSESYVTLGKWH